MFLEKDKYLTPAPNLRRTRASHDSQYTRYLAHSGSVRGSPNGTIGSQWYHWLTNGTIGRANGTIGITIGTNGKTNGTIGRTLNDIGIPLFPLVEP